MAKSHDTRKDVKKKAEKTLKEKRREKKARKEGKETIGREDRASRSDGRATYVLNPILKKLS